VFACELGDGIGDQAPDRRAVAIVLARQRVGAFGALLLGILALAFQHQGRGPPDVDVRDHGRIAMSGLVVICVPKVPI